jgi:hypothetical protein
MIYTGTIDQRHMAAHLDQLPADQYATERLDRVAIELAGRVARGCIRGVVTAILAGDERTADWDVLRVLTSYEQAQILESGTSPSVRPRCGACRARTGSRRFVRAVSVTRCSVW